MISLLLLRQIAQMFIYLLMGWILVRAKIIKSEDSRILSLVILCLMIPCVTISAFQMDCTPELLHGMLLSTGAAILLYLLIFLVAFLLRPLRLTPVEQASVIYSNAGNLVIPLVAAIFGKEWVIYTNMVNVTQLPLMWSHGRILISGERSISVKKILLHVNMISALVGSMLFLFRIPLPGLLLDSLDAVGSMIGPTSMMVTGMLMANMDLKRIVRIKGVWRVSFLRLIVIPLILASVLKYSGLATLVPDGETILLISLLGTITPSASSVTQLAQAYRKDPVYAGAINVITTLLCIITMPLIIAFYQL